MNVGGFQLADVAGPERDQQVVGIVVERKGAIDWGFVQVPLENNRGYFLVARDYFAIGNDSDWCRIPVGGAAAQVIADQFNALLPTAFMVDLIWRFGSTKLAPQPFKDLAGMTSTSRFVEHNGIIERQRRGRQGLVVGHKKDLIVSNRLELFPTAVCIYGWHQGNGQPIQPVSTAHRQWWYSDYSHGCRFVKKQMVLDGQTVDVEKVLRDPQIAHVLTGGKPYAARTKTSKDTVDDSILRVTRYNTTLLTKGETAPPQYQGQAGPARAPAPEPSSDLGLRALNWCRQELAAGVHEEPMGSNAGPRIAQYFAPARRRATGQTLGIEKGDWCAVAQSAALAAVVEPNEAVPHGYRAAVWELEDDAKESNAWVSAADIRSGKYALRPGDLVVWTRGQAGSRLGHVSRVETPPDANGEMVTIGGNENNAWTRRTRNIKEAEFRGAIKYRDFAPVNFGAMKAPNRALPPAIPITQSVQHVQKTELVLPDKVLTNEGWLQFEEEYLPRVVTGENGRAHPEALKAQAIASRTYCLRAMQDDPKLGRTNPIVNSQKFQVFVKKALPQCVDAVNATRGMVAKYGGRLIIANYVAGSIWKDGKPGSDPTNTEKWVTYNEGRTGPSVQPTRLSSMKRPDNRGCMSQNGADWLGRNGRSYIFILRYFYGADIEIVGRTSAFVPIRQPREEAVMATTQIQINNQQRKPLAVRRPSGIEALAMSVGASRTQVTAVGCIGPKTAGEKCMGSHRPGEKGATHQVQNTYAAQWPYAGTQWAYAATQWPYAGAQWFPYGMPPQMAVGEDGPDQLALLIGVVKRDVDSLTAIIQNGFSEESDHRKKWEAYRNQFYLFMVRNIADTPLREADAMQRAFQYQEGVKEWHSITDILMNQGMNKAYDGKIGESFPILPAIGIVALLGLGAALLGSASR
jgi:hypothetical protein